MILDEIVKNKRQEIAKIEVEYKLIDSLPKPLSFYAAFPKEKVSLIAEIKKASPSAGVIREKFHPTALAKIYEQAGASAISVLTDKKYFQGELHDLQVVKHAVSIPILRKDFIIDQKQVYEARIAGADAILLIARILSDQELVDLLKLTEKLGMQALVEIHDEQEAERVLKTKARIIGINNRDLQTLKIDLQTTLSLLKKFPELTKRIIVSESGIETSKDIEALKQAGVSGVLIGTSLLKAENIPAKISELLGPIC